MKRHRLLAHTFKEKCALLGMSEKEAESLDGGGDLFRRRFAAMQLRALADLVEQQRVYELQVCAVLFDEEDELAGTRFDSAGGFGYYPGRSESGIVMLHSLVLEALGEAEGPVIDLVQELGVGNVAGDDDEAT